MPDPLPRKTPAQKARAADLLALLKARYPDAHCELDWTKPHELLIATILSAQCTDVAVNKATPGLFKAFPTPADYARATPAEIEPFIRSIGLFRSKAKAVHETCRLLIERFGGEVEQHDVYHEQVEFGLPGTLKEEMRKRGVDPTGRRVLRKDADEAMGAWLDRHGIAHRTVDRTVGSTK